MSRMGIYAITNVINGKLYIGSSTNLDQRFRAHLYDLRAGIHHNSHLQNAFNKYGEKFFDFSILELIEKEEGLIKREQAWIDFYFANNSVFGYNQRKDAGTNFGRQHSPETKAKIGAITRERILQKGHPLSGRKHSLETRTKISIANKGHKHTEEAKRKIGNSSKLRHQGSGNPMFGRKFTAEHRAKIGLASRGNEFQLKQEMQ